MAKAIADALGRALSHKDIERIHGWPYQFDRLSEDEITREAVAMAKELLAKGQPIRTVAYFEPALQETQARRSDNGVRPHRQTTPGFSRIGDVL